MPAIDTCEPPILRALQKDGWHIHRKPYTIHAAGRTILADFSLQRITEDQIEEIVVLEVKCFTDPADDLQELYTAIGQYQVYRYALYIYDEPLPLYLAVPSKAYTRLTRNQALLAALQNTPVKMVIIDIEAEEVVQWLT